MNFLSVPGESRTPDLPLRRRTLYPSELQGLVSERRDLNPRPQRPKRCALANCATLRILCRGRDSNPHALVGHKILSLACLPIPAPRLIFDFLAFPQFLLRPLKSAVDSVDFSLPNQEFYRQYPFLVFGQLLLADLEQFPLC